MEQIVLTSMPQFLAYGQQGIKVLQRFLRPKRLAILEAVVIGLVAAVTAVILKQGVLLLGAWRIHDSWLPHTWLLPGAGFLSGSLAGLLLQWVAPEAAGSGVPQVKAALAYVAIPLNLRVAAVKLVSTMLILSSGFVLGRQGPTVHIGAALAAQLSRWVPASPDHQRQLLAAGAAAGLAAGFDAPIAGVMFVIEELLHDVSSLTLGTAILASFTGGVISRVLGGPNLRLGIQPHQLPTHFSISDIPFFLLLGIGVGLLAALFNHSILRALRWSRQYWRWSLPWKLGTVGLLSGGVIALLPITFRDSAILQEMLTSDQIQAPFAIAAFLFQFGLTVLACSAEAPGGLFVPSLILGSAVGQVVGLLEHQVLQGEPVIFALAGMGAFFGAVAKVPITAIVIIFEMTTSFQLVLPLMISAVTAYLVAERFAPGSLYTHLLALKGIYLDEEESKDGLWARLTAADVMQTKVETLPVQMRLEEVIEAFSQSHHRGFPVVDQGKLVGIITQTDLAKLTQAARSQDWVLRDLMTPKPITVTSNATLSHVLYLLTSYKLSRLPVVEQRRIVGIITRSDILRVESDHLRGKTPLGPQPEPSYVVYQTRSPATGQGRLLLPLSNPETAEGLLKMALAIAQAKHYEVECLQVVLVPRHCPPAETRVVVTRSRRLLKRAVHLAEKWQVPIHTQIRVAHNVPQAVLETIRDRTIDLLLMGWKGSTSTPGRIFGDTVDTAIRQAACDVVLVKPGVIDQTTQTDAVSAFPVPSLQMKPASELVSFDLSDLNRWLVPMAGGPNAEYAVRLLPALVSMSAAPRIRLCQVVRPSDLAQDMQVLEASAAFLEQRLRQPVLVTSVCAESVAEAVLDMVQKDQCDVVVLGASREGLLQQAIQGNIPEVIARECRCPVILVRKAVE